MFGLGLPETIIIVVALIIFFFGGDKLSELGKGLGRFTGEFKKGKAEMEEEIQKAEKEFRSGKKLG
jgi:sec-independent protein translocase protein TatA